MSLPRVFILVPETEGLLGAECIDQIVHVKSILLMFPSTFLALQPSPLSSSDYT